MKLADCIQRGYSIEVTLWDPDLDDDAGESFQASIKDYREGRIYLDVPQPLEQRLGPHLLSGMKVGAVYTNSSQQIIFYPRIFSARPYGRMGYLLEITDATDYEIIQRRKHARIPAMIQVRVDLFEPGLLEALVEESEAGNEPASEKRPPMEPIKTFMARTVNLSGGGLRLMLPEPLEMETWMQVTIRVTDLLIGRDPRARLTGGKSATEGRGEIRLKAKVVFFQENTKAAATHDAYACGVQFMGLTQHEESVIVRECFRRELALKARRPKD